MDNKIDINPDRPLLVGPEVPTRPFPFALQGIVVKGYGRGSKQLGIPTGKSVQVQGGCAIIDTFLISQLV
jgi:hypothetical protein